MKNLNIRERISSLKLLLNLLRVMKELLDSIKYVLPLSGILVQDGDNISQIKSSKYKQKFRFAITQRSDDLKFIIYYVLVV